MNAVPGASQPSPQAAAASAQRALEASACLAALFEASMDAMLGCDRSGAIVRWSPAAEAIFGHPAGEILGRSIQCLLPADRQDDEAELLQQLQRGECMTGQRRAQRQARDGRLVDVAISVAPIRGADGRLLGAVQVLRDISAELRDAQELSRVNRLNSALRQIHHLIIDTQDRDELLAGVCRTLVERGGVQMAWIGWVDMGTRLLRPVAQAGDEQGYLASIRVAIDDRPEGRGPSGLAFRSGRPYISNDMLGDAATVPWRPELRQRGFAASAALPIRQDGQVCAVLSVYADRRDFFLDEEVALLTAAAADISLALDAQAREQARQHAEQVMRDETAFSNMMLDSMPGAVYFYDTAGRFLRWNRNFETVTGYSAQEIAGMHPLDFFPPDDRQRVSQRIDDVFSHGESTVEALFLSKSGMLTPYFFTGRRLVINNSPCLVGVGIDISQRKRAESALRDSEARLVEAQRIAGIGSWSLDLVNDRFIGSDQTYAIYGRTRSDGALTQKQVLALVHPEDRDGLQSALRTLVAGGDRLSIELRVVPPDGHEKTVHLLADLKRDAGGQPVLITGTVHDITARTRLAAEHQRRERAEAADRIKSAFLATMSHELRTPLNSIIGFTGILLQGLAGPLNTEQNTQLGMVRTSARHLLALVNDVLDISKIEAGQLEISALPFDLRRAIDSVVALVEPQARNKRLALRLALDPDLGELVGDERRFKQIVINLLSNAVKFTEQGEILLRAQRSGSPARLRLQVTDTGIGIQASDLPQLFQPFRQIDGGLARQHEGTGLGLAICQRLAGLMGGAISVESVWGVGSTFTLQLALERSSSP